MYRLLSGNSKFAVHALRDACVQQAKQTYEFGAAKFCFLSRFAERSIISLAFTKEMGNKDYVHFFDTRQRNEPKKTCIGGEPPYVPPDFARYAKKHSLFCQITRGCCKVQTLLSPFKENGENRGQPTGCHIYFYTNCSKYRTAKVQLYLTTHRKEPTP